MQFSSANLKQRFTSYKDFSQAKVWFEDNFTRIKSLFENPRVNHFVFESFQDVFKTPPKTVDRDIYLVITQVAIINMVLAGLPGQMGVGVFVSMALEAWMAYAIARHVGIKQDKPSDIFKYFGAIAATLVTIIFLFKHILSLAFSAFSVLPFINPLMAAELVVTNLVGVAFWIGFNALKDSGEFKIPLKLFGSWMSRTKELFIHQFGLLKAVLTPSNIKQTALRIKDWLTGSGVTNQRILNGELFANTAMLYLLANQHEKLQGPLGDVFLEAIRLRWSSQFDETSTIEEIAERFREYSPEAMEGAINTIKGKMFEILVTNAENTDNDIWQASMHGDESYPGSDIIFWNNETGETVEVSLKAVSENDTQIIEHALSRYPDLPIMTTDEAAAIFEGDARVFGSGFSNDELHKITQENAQELIDSIGQISATEVVFSGAIIGQSAALWPFVMAYLKRRIDFETLQAASVKIFGNAGVQLASRLSWAVVFGPIYAWYLLARGVDLLVVAAGDIESQTHLNRKHLFLTLKPQ